MSRPTFNDAELSEPGRALDPALKRALLACASDALLGLPALVAGLVMIAVIVSVEAGRSTAGAYEREGARRLEKGDLQTALICYRRLLSLNPSRPDVRFNLVSLYERLGEPERAVKLARSLAPRDGTGYPPAHLWIARRLLAVRPLSVGAVKAAEGHLLRATKATPNEPEAMALLGTLYASTGRPGEARKYLEPVAGGRPELLLKLAGACQALGKRDDALFFSSRALDAARTRTEAHPDDTNSRLLWAAAASFREEYPEALEVLRKGASLSPNPVYPRSMASVHAARALALEKAGRGKNGERVEAVSEGLRLDPSNPVLLNQLMSLFAAGGAEAEKSRALVRDMLTSGKAPEIAHLALGNDAWARGQGEEARAHWEQSYRLSPGMLVVANNLAWMLAHAEPADPTRALAMIDQVLTRAPGDPRFHGTRGQVLLKLGRWKDAVTELELALSGGENTPGIHAALADAYDRLGMPDLAASHHKAAGPAPPSRPTGDAIPQG